MSCSTARRCSVVCVCVCVCKSSYKLFPRYTCIPYSRKIWRGNIFGGLAVYITIAKLKFAKISYSHIYVWQSRIAKFKSANILAIVIFGSTAKFNSRQYFRLYGSYNEQLLGRLCPPPSCSHTYPAHACAISKSQPIMDLGFQAWNRNETWHKSTIT